jgi:hypothetical protein
VAARLALVLVLLAMPMAACAPASSTASAPAVTPTLTVGASPTPEPTPAGDPSHPVGVIAFGHSGLTGEGTGELYEPLYENSWATGTSAQVHSVYARLVEVEPEHAGHVANTAFGGAPADALAQQARDALQRVPFPRLVIISTIDNDIRCDGTDLEHMDAWAQLVRDALDIVSQASPESRILVVGQFGRPSIPYIKRLVEREPAIGNSLRGDGICDFYDLDGKLNPDGFHRLTSIIDAYEKAQAKVCAEFDHCVTDGGVRAAYKDTFANFSPDYAHLNVRGQAAEASLIWPVVEKLLGL